ncbi:MAG: helix-turn-helix transcriptional regulator, partial [Clostridia bacterium]|nr:helix-turn-helix transcriptional regulator [Clostridia bacterium]
MTVEKMETEFEHGAKDVSKMLSQMKYSMSELSVKIAGASEFANGTYIDKNSIREDMRSILVDRRQNEFSKYLTTVFIIDGKRNGYVYELTGTFANDVFFNQYFVSEKYTNEFWRGQTGVSESFEIYPSYLFTTAKEAKRIDVELIPVTYKPQDGNDYIIVALLDAETIEGEYGFSALFDDSNLIYTSKKVKTIDKAVLLSGDSSVREGKIFRYADEQNGQTQIVGFVSNAEINSEAGNAGVVIGLVYVVFLILSLGVAVLVSNRYSMKLKAVSDELVKHPAVLSKYESGIQSIVDINDAIKLVLTHDLKASAEGSGKDSVLDALFLQSRVRDVYVGVEDIEEKVNVSNSVYMIYFKVNYTRDFENYIEHDAGRATFFLMQLVEMYLETWGIRATTFQVENNGIVSVFDAEEEPFEERDIVDSIVAKLANESEYAFFTVAVSEVCNDVEKLKKVYDNLIDLSKYGKPINETQVLYEGEVKRGAGRFYFSFEDMGKLSALMQNGTEDETIRKFDEILDYNLRKEINSFELYLLCTEIINCAVKLLNRVMHALSHSVDLSNVYKALEQAFTPEEYREVCVSFLKNVMEQVRQNKREDDYIISYILDYVENHYAEDIYLNLFAEKLKLTGAYISSYFKEKMNVNLSDYINNFRIKKALELSENPQ